MTQVLDIVNKMEKFAPSRLKEDFDNVGLMVGDKNKAVKKVLLALDCTIKVIEEAKEKNTDLIITHHPLIFIKPKSITTDTIQGQKIIELIKNDIALYSSHTNLDAAKGGINEKIAEMLGIEDSRLIDKNTRDEEAGIGRIGQLANETTLHEFIQKVKSDLSIDNLRVVRGRDTVKTVAVINGSGQDFIGRAIAMGADTIVTGDTTYHFAADYKEMGINIIDAGHFNTEWPVFIKVMDGIKNDFSDIEFIVSEEAEDPYDFY